MLTILILENIILIALVYLWSQFYGTSLVQVKSFLKLVGGYLGECLEDSVECLENSVVRIREVLKSVVYVVVRRFKQ